MSIKQIEKFETKVANRKIPYTKMKLACGKEINVYEIDSVYELIQFIGYGKYINRDIDVFLRGQTSLYDGALVPSLYRKKERFANVTSTFNKSVNELLKTPFFSGYDKRVIIPLLQHYGIKTNQIDVIDNIWVALWFASNEANSIIAGSNEYVFFHKTEGEFCYILLLASDAKEDDPTVLGLKKGRSTTLVDLRKALPSYYLRPHAQHAYMLMKNEETPNDYSDLIVGIAKIRSNRVLEWLGDNEFLTTRCLFPSVYHDSGYASLVNHYPVPTKGCIKTRGAIQVITD